MNTPRSFTLPAFIRQLTQPQLCQLCHGPGQSHLCKTCMGRYIRQSSLSCPCCAMPVPASITGPGLCGTCLRRPPAYDRTIAVTAYTAPLDQLVHALKFRGKLVVASLFAELMEAAMQELDPAEKPEKLVAVPLGNRRLRERGFNQAHEIARALSRRLAVPLVSGLGERLRETAPQTGIALAERRSNVKNAFSIAQADEIKIRGSHIGLVDDVMTTGETVNEMARVLKQAGATRVTCLVFARTLPEYKD